MKAVVTGGAGFIGSNLAIELISLGYDVTVIDDLSSGYVENIEKIPSLDFVEGDIRDRSEVDKAMDGASVVFHLAASVGNKRSIDFPIIDSQINVLGTLNVLESAREKGIQKIVASSSAGIYGELLTVPIREDHPLNPETPYACSKLCMEKLCLSYARLYDIEAVCLRYFNVYGPNQRFDAYGNVIPIFVFQLLGGESVTIFGSGEQTRDFVNVADVVQANVKAATTDGVSGAYNLASGTQVSIIDLYSKIGECAEIERPPTFGPERPGDVLHSLADISMARDGFDYRPEVGIESGLKKYIAWAQEEFAKSNRSPSD
jgi:UDP-glucose 4-epimerase